MRIGNSLEYQSCSRGERVMLNANLTMIETILEVEQNFIKKNVDMVGASGLEPLTLAL